MTLGLILSACGATPVPNARPQPPSSDALVALIRGAGFDVPACRGMPDAPTLGTQFAAQSALLGDVGHVDETGTCVSADDVPDDAAPNAVWHCTVIATPVLSGDPAEEGTNFSVVFDIDAHGAIIASSPFCVAAG